MKNFLRFLFVYIVFLSFSPCLAQEIKNIDYFNSGGNIIINYELEQCNDVNTYDLGIVFIEEKTNRVLYPKSLKGDVLNVSCGKKNQIIWNIKDDYTTLSGNFYPILDVSLSKVDPNSIGNNEVFNKYLVSNQIELIKKMEPIFVKDIIERLKSEYNDLNLFVYEINNSKPETKNEKIEADCDISVLYNHNFTALIKELEFEIKKILNNQNEKGNYMFDIMYNTFYFSNKNSVNQLIEFCDYLNVAMNEFKLFDNCLEVIEFYKVNQVSNFQNNLRFNQNNKLAKSIKLAAYCNKNQFKDLEKINIEINKNVNSKLFQYSKLNPDEFKNFNNNLVKSLSYISTIEDDGKVNFTYNINFDHKGINLCYLKNPESTNKLYDSILDKNVSDYTLNPIMRCGKYLKINEELNFDLNWSSTIFSYDFKGNTRGNSFYNDYVSRIPNAAKLYGKYEFQQKSIKLNDKTATDIYVTNLKTRGPLNSFYSLMLPGWGLRRVTYGNKKGWGRFTCVALPAAVSLFSSYLSNSYYDSYLKTIEHEKIQQNYDRANLWNKSKYIFATISISVYTYEFFDVFFRGSRNITKKAKLNFPISIQKQSLELY